MIIMVASVACLQNVRHEHGDMYNFERAFSYRAGRGKSADLQGGAKQGRAGQSRAEQGRPDTDATEHSSEAFDKSRT